MKPMQRVLVDGKLSKASSEHLDKVCHTRTHPTFHYCATRLQMFSLMASSRSKVPAAAIISFDVINNPDDFYHTIMCTGVLTDLAQLLGIRKILETRRSDCERHDRYGLNAEGQALFDYLDILIRRLGIFIVPWGSFEDFCSLHQRAEKELSASLELFLDDVQDFLSKQEQVLSCSLIQTFAQSE